MCCRSFLFLDGTSLCLVPGTSNFQAKMKASLLAKASLDVPSLSVVPSKPSAPALVSVPVGPPVNPGSVSSSGIFLSSSPSFPDALREVKVSVGVAGKNFLLPSLDDEMLRNSILLAESFGFLFHQLGFLVSDPSFLSFHLRSVRSIFAPEAFESAALVAADNFQWTDEILARDRDLLHSLGSLDSVLQYHTDLHRQAGMNEERVTKWLSADPNFSLLLTLASTGGEVDVDPDFVPFRHSGPLRPLQQRLLPVYRQHAYKMWRAGKGLLLRLSDIPEATLQQMHTGNSCHLVPKPETPEGRFIIDASNVSEGRVPLNGESAKDQAIARYGAVRLPTIRGVLSRWNDYRVQWNLQWSDMVIFKEDIKSCFNHLRWSTRSSKLLATMVDDDVVFVMVTGGFGHCSTPMQWDVVGQAIKRRVESGAPITSFSADTPACDVGPLQSPLDTYVDDSFGAGRPDHVAMARERVVLVSEGVLAPGASIAMEKRVLAPAADILGFHVDCSTAKIRPKDRAIDKLFFVLFSFDSSLAQPLVLWQCLASLVNMYSPVIRGMRPFVSAIIHMTCRASGHHNQRARASASAKFAIEMWRAAVVLLISDRAALSVSLDIFLLSSFLGSLFLKVISDASPWRLAAGLYDFHSNRLLAWTTLLLPFASDNAHRFQTQREYLGHLLSLLLVVSYRSRLSLSGTVSYQWVNDNTGAIAWVNIHKCSSPSSLFACMAVSQLNLLSDVWAAEAVHIPGSTMGEIDAMSRLEAQSDLLSSCPTLTSDTFVPLESPDIVSLFRCCDPALSPSLPAEHHAVFCDVTSRIRRILSQLSSP